MADKKIPMRKCVGCGEMKPKSELIRIVLTDEGEVELDSSLKKNGRGAYLCNSIECLERAIRSKGLNRSLKTMIPDSVMESLREEML